MNTDLTAQKAEFAFIKHALNGTGGFADGGYLDKYPRESEQKLERRKGVAWYVNHLHPACERFTSYLFKKPPQREINHPLLDDFIENCDWRNTTIDVFLATFAMEAKARGSMLLLVDMPKVVPADKQSQQVQRAIPYLVALKPEDVHAYSLNERGLFDYISINSTQVIDNEEKSVIRWWNTTQWGVTLNGVLLEGGDHNLGVCPVLSFSEGMTFPYVGSFSQIAHISKRLYNMASELDEILRSQTFSLLVYQIPADMQSQVNPSQVAETIGTHNMVTYPSQAPSFVAPPDGPARIYMERMATLEEKIKDISMDASSTVNSRLQESGIALTIRFQTLNSALLVYARKLEDLERNLFDVVCRWLRINNQTKVTWAKDFNISDTQKEFELLTAYQTTDMPQEAIVEKRKQIIAGDFSNLEPEALAVLLDACDAALTSDVPRTPSTNEFVSDFTNGDAGKNGGTV